LFRGEASRNDASAGLGILAVEPIPDRRLSEKPD